MDTPFNGEQDLPHLPYKSQQAAQIRFGSKLGLLKALSLGVSELSYCSACCSVFRWRVCWPKEAQSPIYPPATKGWTGECDRIRFILLGRVVLRVAGATLSRAEGGPEGHLRPMAGEAGGLVAPGMR